MAKATVDALARRLRSSVAQEMHERSKGILENNTLVESFGRAVCGNHGASFSSIGGFSGVAVALRGGSEALCWRVGDEVRGYATRSTQLRRLAKQPVRRDGGGVRSGGRSIRDRDVVGGERRHGNFHGSASRKPWDANRGPRRFDVPDRNRNTANAGQRGDRSSVVKTSKFQNLQLRRHGLQEIEAEGRFLCSPMGFRV